MLLGGAGCRPWPARPLVDEVHIYGLRKVDAEPIHEGLSTAPTPLLFGLFPRVLEYSTYDANVLARDLLRIERYLRGRGYYEAKVTAARVVHTGRHSVRVELSVHEGEPVLVSRIDPGVSALPLEVMLAANTARTMADRDRFDEAAFEEDKRRVERVLFDAGYAFAKVDATAKVDIANRTAHIVYRIDAGPKARYGSVSFIGLEAIPEGPVRENLDIREGDVYSTSELENGEQALINLGVFSTVEIHTDRTRPESGRVPIQVRVQESSLRAVRLGGGSRFDVLRFSANLEVGWENKNFLGGMRRFSINARPGLTFFPTRIDRLEPPSSYLPENRLRAELRQPSFLEGRTTGFVSTEYNVYPLLYPLREGVRAEDERIVGYHEVIGSVGLERALFNHHLRVVPSYNWQGNFPFTYKRGEPAGLDSVRVSFPELLTSLDFRDDPLTTREGVYLSNSLQVAVRSLGGTVSDVRIRPEVRAFLPVKSSVLAARLTFGFLFPSGYAETLEDEFGSFDPTSSRVIQDQQKLLFRAFYSGGPSSNRGYPYRGVGPHGAIGFLVPTGLNCTVVQNANGTRDPLPEGCIRPLGGLTLWEASLEARIPFPIDAPIYGVLFVDASDLTRQVASLRLSVPHLSPGFGLRYLTPIGPVRLDVGWRAPSLQELGKPELSEAEGRPGGDLFGFFPGAVHLAIGEAF